jgi:hypothetical protein
MASCVCGEHDFYVKITPRRKSGKAVARASVAPVHLHCRICHKGINTRRIIARRGGSGGVLLHYWHFGWFGAALPRHLHFGIFFGSAGRPPKKIFLKVTARPQIRLWRKVTRNKKLLVVGIIIVTPSYVQLTFFLGMLLCQPISVRRPSKKRKLAIFEI